jgi:hypothetical protein
MKKPNPLLVLVVAACLWVLLEGLSLGIGVHLVLAFCALSMAASNFPGKKDAD